MTEKQASEAVDNFEFEDWLEGKIWRIIAKDQAEISFKAGYDEGLKVGILDAKELDQGMLKAQRKAGIREVVEWGDNICDKHPTEATKRGLRWILQRECPQCWQAKLKEWGVDA